MIRFVVITFIVYKYAIKHRLKTPKHYFKTIRKYEDAVKTPHRIIRISWFYGSIKDNLNASSAIPFCVILKKSWISKIVFDDTDATFNAFKGTVGHELTHKNNDMRGCKYRAFDRLFINRVNEIHADFGAAEKMFDNSRQILLETILYKMKLVKKPSIDKIHPTWEQRYNYVYNFNFDKTLIRRIANDVGCTNEKLIQKVISHFDEIYLN